MYSHLSAESLVNIVVHFVNAVWTILVCFIRSNNEKNKLRWEIIKLNIKIENYLTFFSFFVVVGDFVLWRFCRLRCAWRPYISCHCLHFNWCFIYCSFFLCCHFKFSFIASCQNISLFMSSCSLLRFYLHSYRVSSWFLEVSLLSCVLYSVFNNNVRTSYWLLISTLYLLRIFKNSTCFRKW